MANKQNSMIRQKVKVVTIWNTYGQYHIARVRAIRDAFQSASVTCFSHCATNLRDYPFFNITPENGEVIVEKDEADLSFVESLFSTLRLLKRHRAELVLACGYERPETLGAVIYARLHRRKCFLMVENRYEDRSRSMSVELIKRLYLKLFDGFTYGGNAHFRYLTRLGIHRDKTVRGYDCVDNDFIQSLAKKSREQRNEISTFGDYLLCVGRLTEKKNWLRLLIAYRQYRDRIGPENQPWKLVIAGEGPMRPDIEKQISDLAIADLVVMVGQVDSIEDVVSLHAMAKLLVLASHHDEQWGLVVNEAMAAARPVLVSRECGCAEDLVRDGKNGFIFDPFSPQDLAEKLLWMHKHEDRLEEMGLCGRQMIEDYSPRQFAEGIKALYERCLDYPVEAGSGTETKILPRSKMLYGTSRPRVFLVGPMPPPVLGLSVINSAVRSQLLEIGNPPIVIDLSPPGLGRAWRVRLGRLAQVVRGFLHFVLSRPQNGDALYMSVSGGFGQVYELLFAALARLLGLRIFLHHHSYAYLDRVNRLTKWLISTAGPNTTHIVLSEGMAARFQAAYPMCLRTVAVSNAAFLGPSMPEAAPRRQSVNVIGFLGNISDAKGIFDFLEVVRKLESENSNVVARLAGPFEDSESEARVRHYMKSVQSIEYVGPKYGEDKTNFLNGVDVLIFPTRYINEAEPVTIHEAMAHGIPVIAFGRGSIAEVVTARCGLTVDMKEDFVATAVQQLKRWRAAPAVFLDVSREARSQFERIRDKSRNEWVALRKELCGELKIG